MDIDTFVKTKYIKINNEKICNELGNKVLSLYKAKGLFFQDRHEKCAIYCFNTFDFNFLTKIKIIFNYKTNITKKEIYNLFLNCLIKKLWFHDICFSIQYIHILTFLSLLRISGKKINIKIKKNKIIIPIRLNSKYEFFFVDDEEDYDENESEIHVNYASNLCEYVSIKYITGKLISSNYLKYENYDKFEKKIFNPLLPLCNIDTQLIKNNLLKFNTNKCEILLENDYTSAFLLIYVTAKMISCELDNIKLEKNMVKKIKLNTKKIKTYLISPILEYKKIKNKLISTLLAPTTKKKEKKKLLLMIEFNKNVNYDNCKIVYIPIYYSTKK